MWRLSKLLILPILLLVILVVPDKTVSAQISQTEYQLEWGALLYPNTSFSDPLWLITYPGELALNWGTTAPLDPLTGLPLDEMPEDNFSARFSTNTPFNAGTYVFTVIADGGVRLTINDNVIIDDLDNTGLQTFSGTAFLGSGQNLIILDYIDYSGVASIEISWLDTLDVEGDETTGDSTESNVATAVVAGVDGLSLRTGPYLGASLVAVLRPGITYTVVAQNSFEGTYTWYKLVTNPAGQTGWASGRYLTVDTQDISSYSCNVTPELALSIAGVIPDPAAQIECSVAAIAAVNARLEAGSVPPDNINAVLSECSVMFPAGSAVSTVLTFIDGVENTISTSELCTTNTATGISIPTEISIFDNLVTLPDTGVTISPRTTMNIRVRPSTRTGIAGQIPWGAEAQLLARTVEAGADNWYLIRYAGIIGWVDASFVNVRGNIADVPIY